MYSTDTTNQPNQTILKNCKDSRFFNFAIKHFEPYIKTKSKGGSAAVIKITPRQDLEVNIKER